MDLRTLESFLVVAEELHFGRAAERLHVAQPALSRAIQSLEKHLGTSLFERTTRKVVLTQAGQTILEHAQQIVDQMNGMMRASRSAADGQIGTVRIGFAGSAGYSIVSKLTRLVSKEAPGISLELIPRAYSADAARLVAEMELDLAIISIPARPDVETAPIQEEGFCLAIPASHSLAHHDSISMAQLEHAHFVSYPATHGSRVRDAMVSMCRAAGFVPMIAQEAPDPYSLLTLVGAGIGVAVVAESTQAMYLAGVKYVEISDPPMFMPLALTWRGANPSGALKTVLQIAQHNVEKLRFSEEDRAVTTFPG